MNFNSIWKSYLNEEKELELLAEARVKDIKKKYPILDKAGWIKYGRSQIEDILGPKGTSKYLMWFARELHLNFEDEIEDNPEWTGTGDDEVDDVTEVANALLEAIMTFQENQQRMEEKDIYKFNSGELQMALSKLGLSSSQLRDKEKAAAMEDTEIVYDDNDIFAVRPQTEASSCYFGKNTRWCISATKTRNYFDQYTSDRKAFVMVRFDNLPANHTLKKMALVFDAEGELEEIFDAQDSSVDSDALLLAVALNHKRTGQNPPEELDEDEMEEVTEIFHDIQHSGYAVVVNNPPDPTASWESKARALEEEYADLIKHGSYGYEIDDYGEGAYLSFWGSFDVELDGEMFEGGEYEMPDGWREESALASALLDKLGSASIYGEELEINEYSGVMTFSLRLGTDGYEYNPDGYESFLDNMHSMDEDHKKMRRVIIKHLMAEGYIAKAAFDTFQTTLEDVKGSLKNLTIIDYSEHAGEEEIRFVSKEEISLQGGGIQGVTPRLLRAMSMHSSGLYRNSKEVDQRVFTKLQDLNQAIQTYLAKQLELPIKDLPPRIVQQLSIPESLKVLLIEHTGGRSGQAKVRITMDNPEANQEELDAIMEIVRFIDNNYDKIEVAVIESVEEVAAEVVAAQREFMENLPDYAKEVLAIAEKSNNREVIHRLSQVDDITIQAWGNERAIANSRTQTTTGPGVYERLRNQVLRSLWNQLTTDGSIPHDRPNPFYETEEDELMDLIGESRGGIQDDISRYFVGVNEEKGRTRQSGIYKFYCMIGYTVDASGDRQRGLDDILADLRALPNVTIVTVVVANRKIAEHRYISGLSVKFIPSIPGQVRSPEDTKTGILRNIRRLRNVERIFKVSTSVERIE